MKKNLPTASVEQILLWYDRPEIVLLKINSIEHVLAVSSAYADSDDNLYVGASITIGRLADYQNGKFDLRFAISHSNYRRYWKFNFDGMENNVEISRITKSSPILTASIPDSGFFSRDHHRIEAVEHYIPDAEEKFLIDGSWELGEFSKLYSQIEDIYYIFNDIRRFRDPSVSAQVKSSISDAMDRPWKGGGSYVGYYDKIANDNAPEAKLRVSGIKYNSPGYVAIKAKQKPFNDMIDLLQSYADHRSDVKSKYNTLYEFMARNKFLAKEATNFIVSDDMKKSIAGHAKELDQFMPGIYFDTFLSMARNSHVIAAKILLSVFRRMDKLFLFFEEGRVKYKGLNTDPMADDDF